MMWLYGDEIDCHLISKYHSGIINRYETYFFEIYLHGNMKSIGYIDLRVGHNEQLYYLGNIGYRIQPAYRGHGYAAKACRMILPVAKSLFMKYLLITCDPDNIASRKTIERVGFRFVEVAEVPPNHMLHRQGEHVKAIYRMELEEAV